MQNSTPSETNQAEPSDEFLAKYIPIEEFAFAKGMPAEKIIQMIRAGACVGFYKHNAWYVGRNELQEFKGEGCFAQFDTGKPDAAQPQQQNNSILTALPRGQLGLPTTFWIFAVLGNFIFVIFMIVLVQISEDLTLLLVSAFAVYQYWVLIGVIRSSMLRNGLSGWALLAVILHLAFVAATSFAWLFTFSVHMNGYASH